MSAYDTVERGDDYWVRVYIEAPHNDPADDRCRVLLGLEHSCYHLSPDKADAIGRALLKAAARARQPNPMVPR